MLHSGNDRVQEKDDLLSRFVKMSKQGDNRFGDRALRDIMVNYILAGKDSTSAAICWTIYMLVLHPEVNVKVRQELADLVQQQSPPSEYYHGVFVLDYEKKDASLVKSK